MPCRFIAETHCPVNLSIGEYSARSAINSVVIVTGQDWTEVVRSLMDQTHKRARMPTYEPCVKAMIIENGFTMLRVNSSLRSFLQKCDEECHQGEKFIVNLDQSAYLAVVPNEDPDGYRYVVKSHLGGRYDFSHLPISGVWKYTKTAGARKIAIRGNRRKYTYPDEHLEFAVENVNPAQRIVGDCAVRALSSAYGCTWDEAIDRLAQANHYTDPVINSKIYIDVALIKAGFERHRKIVRYNRTVCAKEFCDELSYTYHNGERVFAYLGTSHCAAILPFEEADGTVRYKVQDTWDSTSRRVEEYWVLDPKKIRREKERQKKQGADKTVHCESLSVGQHILHPSFGSGVIVSESNGILEIEFDTAGKKKLARSWLMQTMNKK